MTLQTDEHPGGSEKTMACQKPPEHRRASPEEPSRRLNEWLKPRLPHWPLRKPRWNQASHWPNPRGCTGNRKQTGASVILWSEVFKSGNNGNLVGQNARSAAVRILSASSLFFPFFLFLLPSFLLTSTFYPRILPSLPALLPRSLPFSSLPSILPLLKNAGCVRNKRWFSIASFYCSFFINSPRQINTYKRSQQGLLASSESGRRICLLFE